MNETTAAAQSMTQWISVTPDRVLVLGILIGAIIYLVRRNEKQGRELRDLYEKCDQRAVQSAVVMDRNNTLFERVMKRLDKYEEG